MTNGLPSLHPISAKVEAQLERQLQHFDGLDNKAGIVLGFASVVVAVADGSKVLATTGRLCATAAALLALWSFLPRSYPVVDTKRLRERYLRSDPQFTKLHLLDTHIAMEEMASDLLERKAFRLKMAVGFLSFGVLLIGVGIMVAGR